MTHHCTMPPSEEECEEYLELYQQALVFYPKPNIFEKYTRMGISKGFHEACRFIRDRMKPVERLSGKELEDLATAFHNLKGLSAQAFYEGYRTAEARILGS